MYRVNRAQSFTYFYCLLRQTQLLKSYYSIRQILRDIYTLYIVYCVCVFTSLVRYDGARLNILYSYVRTRKTRIHTRARARAFTRMYICCVSQYLL